MPARRPLQLGLALLLLPPAALVAQGRDTVTLTPVVVTATRVPTSANAIPSAITVLTGDELRAQGIRTVADALRLVPGSAVMSAGSFGSQTSLFLRGGESDYVKVLVDGVPANLPGGSFDFANLTTDAVDRIEIVRGPVSVLYGSDAVTGVVQIFTRVGRGAPGGRIGFAAGRYGSETGVVDLGGGGPRVAYGLGLSQLTTDGIYPFNNQYHNAVASARVRLTPDEATDVSLTGRYSDAVFHFPTDGGGALVDSNQATAQRGPAFGLDAGRKLSSRVSIRVNAGWREEQDRYDDPPDGPTDFPYHSKDVVRRFLAGARADMRAGSLALVSAGLDYDRESQSGSTLDTVRRNAAPYAQLLLGTDRRLSATLGVRVDDNQQFGTHVTERGGLVWLVTAATRVRLAMGTGFKEPTFYENFATGFARGNPRLEPEQSTSWEVGVEQALAAARASVSVTYFHQHFRDLIQYSGAPVGPDSVNYVNVADATAEGLELGAHAGLGPRLSLDASYTYLASRDGATGARLQRRPTHAGSLGLRFAPVTRASATLAVLFTGDRDDFDYSTYPSPRVTLPAHSRVDLACRYAPLAARGTVPGLAVAARVENLLDARYEDIANFPAPRRTLWLEAEVRFGP